MGAMTTPDLRMTGPAGPLPHPPSVLGRVEVKVPRGQPFTLDHLRALVAAADGDGLSGDAAVTANVRVSGKLGALVVTGPKTIAPPANGGLTDGR